VKSLENRVAVVAGATRGAGRGIARALGEAGAIVYCSGRSVRGHPATAGRSETIDETAELVTAAGGRGIAVRTDHSVERDVEALFLRVRDEHGRLDVLVNDIWGGDAITEWGKTFWEVDVAQGFTMLERAVHTHIITSRHGVPLMLEGTGGLVVEITDGTFRGYRGQLFYDLCKTSVIRLAYAMAIELRDHPITALAVTPGFLRSEAVLEHFGVSEENWPDAIAKDRHFAQSETPLLVGRAVAALAADPEVHTRAGRVWSTWDLSRHYGFTDVDGRQPHWDDYLDGAIRDILNADAPSKDDLFLLSMRVHQLDLDADRADERARIEALLKAQGGAMRLDPK
jgi:NAD(P)-dependent dehydrogenase (short-subunit alcohol dehydrogenase family)